MMTELVERRYPGYPTRSFEEALDAKERIERYRLHRAQELRRQAEEIEQQARSRLKDIIDARAYLTRGEMAGRSEQ